MNVYDPANLTRSQIDFYIQLDAYTEHIYTKTVVIMCAGDFNQISTENYSQSKIIWTGKVNERIKRIKKK